MIYLQKYRIEILRILFQYNKIPVLIKVLREWYHPEIPEKAKDLINQYWLSWIGKQDIKSPLEKEETKNHHKMQKDCH